MSEFFTNFSKTMHSRKANGDVVVIVIILIIVAALGMASAVFVPAFLRDENSNGNITTNSTEKTENDENEEEKNNENNKQDNALDNDEKKKNNEECIRKAYSDATTITLAIKECQADIAAKNDETYDGTVHQNVDAVFPESFRVSEDEADFSPRAIYIPRASTEPEKLNLLHIAAAKKIFNAFENSFKIDGIQYKLYWDSFQHQCIYLGDRGNGSFCDVDGNELKVSDDDIAQVRYLSLSPICSIQYLSGNSNNRICYYGYEGTPFFADGLTLSIKNCLADIASHDTKDYGGQTIDGVVIPSAIKDKDKITLAHIMKVKGFGGALNSIEKNKVSYKIYWSKNDSRCVYIGDDGGDFIRLDGTKVAESDKNTYLELTINTIVTSLASA